jgi:hypothetical protein
MFTCCLATGTRLIVIGLACGSVLGADVLLEGKNPVEKGTGDVVGTEVRWKNCDGSAKTYANPPYSIVKHANDCYRLGPKDIIIPEPAIFGLTCKEVGSTTKTTTTEGCTVSDEKAARHFFEVITKGERVKYEMHGTTLTLVKGADRLTIDTKKWRDTGK